MSQKQNATIVFLKKMSVLIITSYHTSVWRLWWSRCGHRICRETKFLFIKEWCVKLPQSSHDYVSEESWLQWKLSIFIWCVCSSSWWTYFSEFQCSLDCIYLCYTDNMKGGHGFLHLPTHAKFTCCSIMQVPITTAIIHRVHALAPHEGTHYLWHCLDYRSGLSWYYSWRNRVNRWWRRHWRIHRNETRDWPWWRWSWRCQSSNGGSRETVKMRMLEISCYQLIKMKIKIYKFMRLIIHQKQKVRKNTLQALKTRMSKSSQEQDQVKSHAHQRTWEEYSAQNARVIAMVMCHAN